MDPLSSYVIYLLMYVWPSGCGKNSCLHHPSLWICASSNTNLIFVFGWLTSVTIMSPESQTCWSCFSMEGFSFFKKLIQNYIYSILSGGKLDTLLATWMMKFLFLCSLCILLHTLIHSFKLLEILGVSLDNLYSLAVIPKSCSMLHLFYPWYPEQN